MTYDGIQVEDFIHMIPALNRAVYNRPSDIGGLAIFLDIMDAENPDARRHAERRGRPDQISGRAGLADVVHAALAARAQQHRITRLDKGPQML